jgi:hypothetical protein
MLYTVVGSMCFKNRLLLIPQFFTALLMVVLAPQAVNAAGVSSNVQSTQELEYGVILFDYFQHDYFSALIEQEYAQAINNSLAKSPSGQVLKGGMMLSYGMPDESKKIFDQLLDANASVDIKNRAWFYLAKLLYNKSDLSNAKNALENIKGKIPDDLHTDYHYLATLLGMHGEHLIGVESPLKNAAKDNSNLPYLIFNLAIIQLKDGELALAVTNLEKVTEYSGASEEMSMLADRARHGLAELAIQHGNLPQAWKYLTAIRTTGLYSNRALLSYAWAAINLKQFKEALPALEMLNTRSIAIPEVQEAKVLLAHLYEQDGALRKALKSNLLAEKEFKVGIDMLNEARRVIDKQNVPKEFIANLRVMMDETDWYGATPSVEYKKLTPFLIDLMASHPFHEALRELADLYAIEENLNYWLIQASEHQLILENAEKKKSNESFNSVFEKIVNFNTLFAEQNAELKLNSLALTEEEQSRLKTLMGTTDRELQLLNNKVTTLKSAKKPYEQPVNYKQIVLAQHEEIKKQLLATETLIPKFETIMRGLIKIELDKHEERMRYYLAQSRLAKARLYDMTLLSLEKAKSTGKDAGIDASGEQK